MKTLVITGASKGIGLAIADKFLLEGFRVINLSRTPCPLSKVENYQVDLSSEDLPLGLRAFFDEALGLALESAEGSRLKVPGEICLVHNAAKLSSDRAQDTSEEEFQAVIQINLVAVHSLNQLLIPRMNQGSSIIYIGSTLAEKAVANSYSYVVTKHALLGMMRSSCQDLSGTGVHTSCICPGFTDTEMLRAHVGNEPDVLRSIAASSAFGRLIEPEEIAKTVYFASRNPVINGAVIHANLGQIES